MKRIFAMMLGAVISAAAQDEIPLWNGDMPGTGAEAPEQVSPNTGGGVIRLTHVSRPTLTLFPVKDAAGPHPFVIVCPGGGYGILAFDKEGTEIAEWFNSIGVSCGVLKYRVPKNREGALQDARRAVRLVREKSDEWRVSSLGMLGFSAGGHLTASCSNSEDRPDFTVLVYPAYLSKPGGIELVEELQVDSDTPPAFVVQALDDKKFYRSTLAYSAALDAAGVPCEVHLFARGGHGFGLRPSNHPVFQWPTLCEAWMRSTGILK
jgi:acetyl esterase/lipase